MQALILTDGRIERTTDVDVVTRAHAAGQSMWVDLEERNTACDGLLADTFKLHPLVVEDIWHDRSVPKLEDYDDYLYLVVHSVQRGSSPARVDLMVLDVVFGATFVITQHKSFVPAQQLRERLSSAPELLAKGTPWLVHAIVDQVVDQYLPLMDALAEQADDVEVDVLRKAGSREDNEMLRHIYELKKSVQSLARVSAYQRDVLGRLAGGTYDDVPKDALPYFRDVNDHFLRVADRVDEYRDVVTGTMDAFLNMQSNRMNATMKTLATISTLMLPLSFIASVYGMNFGGMPEIHWKWGYPYVLTLMVVVGTSLVALFKYKRWI